MDLSQSSDEDEVEFLSDAKSEHSMLAQIFSGMVRESDLVDFISEEIEKSPTKDYNSVSLMNLLVSQNAETFQEAFTRATNSNGVSEFTFDYFVNEYLKSNPGLTLSFPKKSLIKSRSSDILVFSEPLHDILLPSDGYFFYDNEKLIKKDVPESGPDFPVVVIQNLEGFVALDQNKIDDSQYFDNNSRVSYCDDLVDKIATLNYSTITSTEEIVIGSQKYDNPFKDMLFITNNEITNNYHNSCTGVQKTSDPNFGSRSVFLCDNGQQAIRTTYNSAVNREHSLQIKIPAGNALLELNNDWCAWWNANCRFQIDLYLPSKYSTTTFSPVQPGPYFAWYKEDHLKTKNFNSPTSELVFVPWNFESGNHGDEWKYKWTGKHRLNGVKTTQVIGQQLSSSVGFKAESGASNSLGMQNNATFTSKYKNTDLDVGGTFVYFCDNMFQQQHGKDYSTGDVVFKIKEKP